MKKTPLWVAARGLLAERGADFFHCWGKTSVTCDPEDIHDLRVASRRLREGLSLFGACYPGDRISFFRKKIRETTQILGDLRNIDVGLEFFREESAELGANHRGAMAECIALYEKKREAARKKLKRDLGKMNPGSLRKSFVATIHAPYLFNPPHGKAYPFTPLDEFARESIDQRLTPVLGLVSLARQQEEAAAQHRLRICIKRYRYRMEVLSLLMGEEYHELHGHVKEYQDILGRIHDLDVFAELITGIGLPKATEQALAGLIAAKRVSSFKRFLGKLETEPLESIGARVRGLL